MNHPDQQPDGTLLCRFDSTSHADLGALHEHLKRFRVSREKYYTLYHERKDKLTGAPIPFKDFEQYLSQEFATKVTMKKWLAKNPEEGLAWSKAWLARRKESKGLVYAPSQAELRMLQCPSMPYYEQMAANEGGYYGVTRALGYADRYTLEPLSFDLSPTAQIIRDSREQNPISFKYKTRSEALSVGDYALASPYDKGTRIERKSLNDFAGTLTDRKVSRKGGRKGTGIVDSSFQRFDRELVRAKEQNLYVVMVVESSITDVQRLDYLPQTQWTKASPSYLLCNLRILLTHYPLNFQCVFTDGREEMARVMVKIFALGEQVKRLDLQFHLEIGTL